MAKKEQNAKIAREMRQYVTLWHAGKMSSHLYLAIPGREFIKWYPACFLSGHFQRPIKRFPMGLLHLSSSRCYYLYNGTVNMRLSFNGLTNVIRAELDHNPLSGDVFVFFNRHRNQYYTRSGRLKYCSFLLYWYR